MSTLVEIQAAVSKLGGDEKKALALWLESQFEPELSGHEEEKLLASLDHAIQDVDAGRGSSIEDVRRRVASWATK
jgi:hypothetical protein